MDENTFHREHNQWQGSDLPSHPPVPTPTPNAEKNAQLNRMVALLEIIVKKQWPTALDELDGPEA
jgi:hypothetical protein